MLRIAAVILLCFIIVNLVWGLVALLRDQSGTTRTVKALSWRVGLSLALFLLIIGAAALDIFPG